MKTWSEPEFIQLDFTETFYNTKGTQFDGNRGDITSQLEYPSGNQSHV